MPVIYPLSEGTFTVGHDKELTPFDLEKDELQQRPQGSLLIEIQPFLVITSKDIIIFDTGLGVKEADGMPRIQKNVIACGVEPGAVTKVFHSHLHKDHSGGMTFSDDRGMVYPVFPNAEYFLYRPEVSYALQKGQPSYDTQAIEKGLSALSIHWLDGEEDLIDGYIRFVHSGGHCPEHVVFILEDQGQTIFFGGDEAPQLKQVLVRYVAKYDYDGKKALAIREKYADLGRHGNWKFLFYHDVKNAVATLPLI